MTCGEIERLAIALMNGEDITPPPPRDTPGEDAGSWIAIRIAIPMIVRMERERCAKLVETMEHCCSLPYDEWHGVCHTNAAKLIREG